MQAPSVHGRVEQTTWLPIALLALVLIGAGLMRMLFGPLQDTARLELQLSDFDMSLVQGFAAGFPGAVIALPLAWIIDHGTRVRLLLALIFACVVGTLWTAYVDSFNSLFLARMVVGVGANSTIAVVLSLSADLCIAERRGRAVLLMALGAYVGLGSGFALGGALVKLLADHPLIAFGQLTAWRQSHLLVGLAGAVSLLPLLWLKEPQRHEVERIGAALKPALAALWGKRAFLAPFFAGQIGVTLADTSATIWAAPVLTRSYHLQPGDFSVWMGALIFIGGMLGSVLGAFSADWGQKSGRRGAGLIGAALAAGIGIPGALFPIMPGVAGFAWLLGLLLVAGGVINLVASATVAVLIPNDERGICIALFGIINSAVGMGIAPTLVILCSRAMGGETHLAASLCVVGLATGVLSLCGYLIAMKNAPAPLAVAPGSSAAAA